MPAAIRQDLPSGGYAYSVSGKLFGFLGTFFPHYKPFGSERSSWVELPCHCGVSCEILIKVLLVPLHLRHFQEFLGDLCDHFIVTKRGVSSQECCHFMKIILLRHFKEFLGETL